LDSTGELTSGPRPVTAQRSDDDGFTVASTQGGSINKSKGRAQQGDSMEDDDGEPEADVLIRLFEFDD
jgi:hypothetical protein